MKKWICYLLIVSLSGCFRGESSASPVATLKKQSMERQRPTRTEATPGDSTIIQPATLKNQPAPDEPVVSALHASGSSEELSHLLGPLTDGECFFSAPISKKVQAQGNAGTEDGASQRDSIRLLGFVQIESNESSKFQAILRVDGKLAYVNEGDQLNDLEVLSISAPVVTLQQHRQRWSISLHDQPTSPSSSPGRFVATHPPARPNRQGRSTLSGNQPTSAPAGLTPPTTMSPSSMPELPPVPSIGTNESNYIQSQSSAAVSGPSEATGPQLPQLPQLPELPGTPDLPELPGDLELDDE